MPIALSFTLIPLLDATPLQAFAAGAALCSTSLGTTFTFLAASGLSCTRLGTVLTTAAMLDDVVGLVMVKVIEELGKVTEAGPLGMTAIDVATIVRPLAVCLAFMLLTPLACWGVVGPGTRCVNVIRKHSPKGIVARICKAGYTPVVVHTLLLVAFVAGSSYAGTSNLFAAYLAGAVISWWDSDIDHPTIEDAAIPCDVELSSSQEVSEEPEAEVRTAETGEVRSSSGIAVFEKYYVQPVQRVLKPFFFVCTYFPKMLSITLTKRLLSDLQSLSERCSLAAFYGAASCSLS